MATRTHEDAYREVIHPALAIATPVLGVITAASLAEDLLGWPFLTPVFVLVVTAAAITEIVIGNLVAAHRGGWEARLREFLLVSGAAYAVFYLLDRNVVPTTGAVWLPPALKTILIALCWFSAHRRHGAFRPREDFLRSVRGRSGRELRHTMRDTRGFATDILLRLREANSSAAVGFVLLLVASAVIWASENDITGTSFALLVIYGSLMVMQASVLNTFRQEFAVYGEGIRVPSRYLRRVITSAGLFVVAALLLSLPFARDASPLSPVAVARVFEAIRAWVAALPEADLPNPEAFTLPPLESFLGDFSVAPHHLAFSRFWEAFARIFRVVALVTGAVAVTVFIVWPVFSRHFRRLVGRAQIGRRLVSYVVGLLALLLAATRVLLTAALRTVGIRPRRRHPRAGVSDAGDGKSEEAPHSQTRASVPRKVRRQRNIVTRMLEDIAEEGKKKGAPHDPSQTAREYSRTLESVYPDLVADLETVRSTAEDALYSHHRVDRHTLRDFARAARSVLRTLKEA